MGKGDKNMAKVHRKIAKDAFKAKKLNATREAFKFGIKGGKVRQDHERGRSIRWAERVEEKKKELGAEGLWKLLRVNHVYKTAHCEFCNHEIVWKFLVQSVPAKNSDEKPQTLEIGSECVKYFTSLDSVIEIVLSEIRSRKHVVDIALKMQKIYKFMVKNQKALKGQHVDWEYYGKVESTTALDVLRTFIENRKKPRVTERAMHKLDIPVNGDWYEWTKKEEEIRNNTRNIKEIKGNDIIWEIPAVKLPKYPKYNPKDFTV